MLRYLPKERRTRQPRRKAGADEESVDLQTLEEGEDGREPDNFDRPAVDGFQNGLLLEEEEGKLKAHASAVTGMRGARWPAITDFFESSMSLRERFAGATKAGFAERAALAGMKTECLRSMLMKKTEMKKSEEDEKLMEENEKKGKEVEIFMVNPDHRSLLRSYDARSTSRKDLRTRPPANLR